MTDRASACLYLGTPTPLRLWTGAGDVSLPSGGPDAAGGVYRGAVALKIPQVTLHTDGGHDRAEIVLSGTDGEVMGLATTYAADAQGAAFGLGVVAFDANWALDGGVDWLGAWTVDTVRTAAPIPRDGQPRVRTVTLGLTSGDARRSRPRAAVWSDVDHQSRNSGDRFFEGVASIATAEKIWPRF